MNTNIRKIGLSIAGVICAVALVIVGVNYKITPENRDMVRPMINAQNMYKDIAARHEDIPSDYEVFDILYAAENEQDSAALVTFIAELKSYVEKNGQAGASVDEVQDFINILDGYL